MASISEPFIRRPVGTTLLAIGLFLVGIVAYVFCRSPRSQCRLSDDPGLATRPGADPSVMAATVAAPLERRLGQIAGIDQITSTSSLGNHQHPVAILDRPRHRPRRARRAGRDQRLACAICRATCRRCRASAKPIPPRAQCSCWR